MLLWERDQESHDYTAAIAVHCSADCILHYTLTNVVLIVTMSCIVCTQWPQAHSSTL